MGAHGVKCERYNNLYRSVAQLVARTVRGREVVGSNPTTPTKINTVWWDEKQGAQSSAKRMTRVNPTTPTKIKSAKIYLIDNWQIVIIGQ